MTLQKIWKKYRSYPAYQHLLYLMNEKGILKISKEDFKTLDKWDDLLDKIGSKNKKEWEEELRKDNFNWNSEFSEEYIRNLKLCITQLEKQRQAYYNSLEKNKAKGLPFFTRKVLALMWPYTQLEENGVISISPLEKKINKLKFSLRVVENKEELKENQITDEMIVRAREFPFENLIKVDSRKFAVCPFHSEKTPSFFVKNNFGYCFGCNKSADTIDFVMKTQNKTFIEAVQSLQ